MTKGLISGGGDIKAELKKISERRDKTYPRDKFKLKATISLRLQLLLHDSGTQRANN